MRIFILLFFVSIVLSGQPYKISDDYLKINAAGDDPLYTTYAAAMERSRLYGDKAYKMDYYSPGKPLHYWSDHAGEIFTIWKFNKVAVLSQRDYCKQPVVTASFPDMVLLEYEPFAGIMVNETFMVYSSTMAVIEQHITNNNDEEFTVDIYPVLFLGNDSLFTDTYNGRTNSLITSRYESKKRLVSNLYANQPYPTDVSDLFSVNFTPVSYGTYSGGLEELYNEIKKNDSLNFITGSFTDMAVLHGKFSLKPGESITLRYYRGFRDRSEDISILENQKSELEKASLQKYIDTNVDLFKSVPRIDFQNEDEKPVYISAFNLVRGCMLPPTGETNYNYYVFSRNPLWGWGHGHQVLHESLSMMAYAYLDAESAQNSQRVFMEQQGEDGLIAYRHGPRGAQTYPHKGKPTTSAPFFSWINWEVYKVSKDRQFLGDAYKSGSAYVDWLFNNRDTDQDGTFEWGPYGIIENVRDWFNVVFQVSEVRYLDVDKEDISDELECLDLSLMVVKEMRSLASMASELGQEKESSEWKKRADELSLLINERMWDEETGFFFNINKDDHSFFFMERDLKRMEIIGLLPLWAEAVDNERAAVLVEHLTDENKFWRKYGVPTLSAEDEWYSPYVDQCCKWNGPVWLLWDYMIYHGLENYGYTKLAGELKNKLMLAVTTQLKKNHNFWESFSADNDVLNSPPNYIWDSIMAKVLIDYYTNE